MKIYQQLAGARPDVFSPDLARSLGVLSGVLASLDRNAEATLTANHSLEILAPFLERYPETYGDLARAIVATALRHSEAVAEVPNRALLERVAQALDRARESRD